MPLYFITGNAGKFAEIQAVIPEVVRLEVDLPEIQSLDPHEVVRAKLLEATKHHSGEFIVEDTSVTCDALGGKLPGPLVKSFLNAMGLSGFVQMAERLGSTAARVICIIGYSDGADTYYFEGVVEGDLVQPRGTSGFDWDKIFIPKGRNQTFAEMGIDEKNSLSHRRQATEKLKVFLDSRK